MMPANLRDYVTAYEESVDIIGCTQEIPYVLGQENASVHNPKKQTSLQVTY